jgi:hypothetical protein
MAFAVAWPTIAPAGDSEIELRGRLVKQPDNQTPYDPSQAVTFKTADGRNLALKRTKLSEALFADPQLLQKELLLKGRLTPDSKTFDVTVIRSIVNGVVCDLYYWCDICSIQQVAPGECMCCREKVRLVEKPVKK